IFLRQKRRSIRRIIRHLRVGLDVRLPLIECDSRARRIPPESLPGYVHVVASPGKAAGQESNQRNDNPHFSITY
ncbi:hypothetical protein, partial [Paraburkholderia hospita]|uniref:hypothetical protein n=1 Tax=Paraburkholderia hospita TaxID=169430 RepID=UPI001A993282